MIVAIIALIKAIPIIDGWVQLLISAYVASQIESMKSENREAIKKAINEHDQRDLEKAIGSTTAGKPSGDPGSTIVGSHPDGL